MHFLNVEQMRAVDRAAVAEKAIPESVLMERAGSALAETVGSVAALCGARTIVAVAGHGNNGGDACVAARCLRADGFSVQVVMTCDPETLKGVAREAWARLRASGVPCRALPAPEDWTADPEILAGSLMRRGVLIDGVLGTGCRGKPTGVAEQAIRWINRLRDRAWVVAADLPSGMNGDTGETLGERVRADVTVTFARPKSCFLNAAQGACVGHLEVADIGIPDDVCERRIADAPCQLIARPEIRSWLPERPYQAHKGVFGHLCVIGGSENFRHAPVLAALGALRSGVGLLTLAVPETSAAAAAVHVPEAMVSALPLIDSPDFGRFDAVVFGPGLSQTESALRLTERVLERYEGKLVVDADGLNALALLRTRGWRPREGRKLILTPHPGEAARLLGVTVDAIQRDRLSSVRRLSEAFGAVAVLKGAGTLVCEPGGEPWLNRTGNPGMAAGGMGDVLSGVVGALWAQGLSAERAAAVAVWAHGTAGDCAAIRESQASVGATAVAEQLGCVFQMIERRGDFKQE